MTPRPTRILAVVTAAFLAIATTPAAAQQRERALPLSAAACPVADTLFGPLAHDLGTVTGVLADSPGVTALSVGPRHGTSFPANATGIIHVGATTMFEGRQPSSLPPFGFELKVFDPAARPIEQRQLSFILNASDTVRVGSMQSAVQNWPGRSQVAQNMAAILSANAFFRLSRSTSAEVDLSGTRYLIPPEVLRDFRALYVAALCGVRP